MSLASSERNDTATGDIAKARTATLKAMLSLSNISTLSIEPPLRDRPNDQVARLYS